jgi:hypothetical protein
MMSFGPLHGHFDALANENRQTYKRELAELVLMLKPAGPLADLAKAIASYNQTL